MSYRKLLKKQNVTGSAGRAQHGGIHPHFRASAGRGLHFMAPTYSTSCSAEQTLKQ